MNGTDGDARRIETAVTAWARTIFSAPRRLGDLVTNIERRDEVVERVATGIVRREVREVRAATSERRSTRPRLDRGSVDPFAHSFDTLKADSEYVAQCDPCGASGLMRCAGCHGTGHGPCPACSGTGKERSAKTGRPIKCKSCKATGSAPCRGCAGNGSIPCRACAGSGHQLAWLTFEETQRCDVAAPADSPIVLTNRVLREGRPVRRDELAAITVVDERLAGGPLDVRQLAEPDRQAVVAQLGRVDRRLERVVQQQYLKLAAIRCDVTYEMCGTQATLSLSGNALAGATTPQAVRPIRRRLYAWCALTGLVWLAGLAIREAAVGSSSYFRDARATSGLLVGVAVGCAIPAIGTALRSWRGGLRFHPMRWPATAWSAGALAAVVSIVVVGLAARPDAAEVQRALAVNDAAKARSIIEAVGEHAGATRDVTDLEDRVSLAEASKLSGDDRLRVLDAVAARKGAAAPGAAADARTLRLEQVRQLIAAQHAAAALEALDKAFPGDTSALVAEERARAHEAAAAACASVACRLAEVSQAAAARATPDRTTAVERAHAQAFDAIDVKQVDGMPTLPRLQQLRKLRDAAAATTKIALDDAELQSHARAAIEFAAAERAKVPVLTNSLAIAEELFELPARTFGGVPSIALDHASVYLSIDRAGRCTGLYAVGDKPAERELRSKLWPADRLVSQAVGKPSVVQPPSTGESTSRWYAGGAPVIARWRSEALVELRIGDATP